MNMVNIKKIKFNWKNHFQNRLYIASFILALVGWFILFVYLFGQFFEKELIALEGTVQSPFFTWGLRISVIAAVIFLIKGKKRIQKLLVNRGIKWALHLIYIIGALGWLAWILSLFL